MRRSSPGTELVYIYNLLCYVKYSTSLVPFFYLLEKVAVRDVLAEKEGRDQVMNWTGFSTVGSKGKGVESS